MNLTSLTSQLRTLAGEADGRAWPAEMIALMREAGCFRAAVPREFGGDRLDAAGRAAIYEAVASGYMSAALILTQHDGACELLAGCRNRELAQRVLTDVAAGRTLATVGISQLTTSRQGGGRPALAATPVASGDGYRLDGVMPWVTSAPHADCIVTGAVLADGMQILAYLPTHAPGVTIEPPMEFCALTDSRTSLVRCDGVAVPPEHLMRPPSSEALARRSPIKSLTVSIVGIGMADALLDGLDALADRQPEELAAYVELARRQFDVTRSRLMTAAAGLERGDAEVPAMMLRAEVNVLVQRLAATLMTLAKGSGYAVSHNAQRLLREAAFFLVWSAPTQVQAETLQRLWR